MRRKMCNTCNRQCPAFDDDCNVCGLGNRIEVVKTKRFAQLDWRYYGPVGKCVNPKSHKEYVVMKLGGSK